MLKPLVKKTIVQEIITNFLHMIQTENFKPGDKILSERELAEQWRVSRTSIREAMQILAFNQVIIVRQGSGTYLNKLPDAMLKKADDKEAPSSENEYGLVQRREARAIIEPVIIRIAAQRIEKKELEEVKRTIGRMEELLAKKQYGGYAIEDINFHLFIAKTTRNKYLYGHLCSLITDSADFYYAFGHMPDLEHWSFTEHKQMYKSLAKHDPDSAEKIMRQHLRRAFKEYREYVGVVVPDDYFKKYDPFAEA